LLIVVRAPAGQSSPVLAAATSKTGTSSPSPAPSSNPSPQGAPSSYWEMMGMAALITALLGGVSGIVTAIYTVVQNRKKPASAPEPSPQALSDAIARLLLADASFVAALQSSLFTTGYLSERMRLVLTSSTHAPEVFKLITDHVYGAQQREQLLEALLLQLMTSSERLAQLNAVLESPLTKAASELPARPQLGDLTNTNDVMRAVPELHQKLGSHQ
jgi:hypothetical protein